MRKKIYDTELQINRNLFKLSVFVTIIAVAMMLAEFFTRGLFPSTKMGAFYIGVLLVYSLHKEALRWIAGRDFQRGERKGEYFVYVWIIITALLYLVNFLSKDYFVFDNQGNQLTALSEITLVALEICAVFIFARIVKVVFSVLYFKNNK